MRQCDWRKGCWQDAYGDERWCYFHSKSHGPLAQTDEQDPFSSDSLEIRKAQGVLRLARSLLKA